MVTSAHVNVGFYGLHEKRSSFFLVQLNTDTGIFLSFRFDLTSCDVSCWLSLFSLSVSEAALGEHCEVMSADTFMYNISLHVVKPHVETENSVDYIHRLIRC